MEKAPQQAAATGRTALVVDDEDGVRSFLIRALDRRGWRVLSAGSAEDGAELLEQEQVDLLILDIALPGRSGLDWLKELEEAGFPGEVVLMTAFADMNTAIDALRAGASDFILKPFRLEQIVAAIDRCFERAHLKRDNFLLRRQLEEPEGGTVGIIGGSEVIERLRALLRRVAPTPSTVLIQGESGVGKELVARSLHQLSQRAQRPFVPVNCAAISSELIEAELFGHVKGAPLPAPRTPARGCSPMPTAAPCSWTRSPSFRCRCNPSCCGCWKTAVSVLSAVNRNCRSMSAWWPPPTAI